MHHQIRAIAKDVYDYRSGWSDPLSVSTPLNQPAGQPGTQPGSQTESTSQQ